MRYEPESIEGSTSKFNAGVLQMYRLHKLQDNINLSNTNLLAFNQDFGVWNFELNFSNNYSLWQEVNPKLGDTEKGELKIMYGCIRDFIEKYPVYETKKSRDGNTNKEPTFNKVHWKVLKKALIDFEIKIRESLDKHGLNSPNEDDGGL